MRFVAVGIFLFFADAANMRCVARLLGGVFTTGIVVGFVQTQMLRLFFARLPTINHDCIERGGEQMRVIGVGAAEANTGRPPLAFD